MILRKLSSIIKSQKGIALTELLVGIAITSAIGGVLVMTIIQTDDVGTSSRNRIVSVNYVHNAGYWIQVDAKMAHSIEVDEGDSGLPLTLSWVEWDNTAHQVTYLVADGELQRIHSANSGSPMTIAIARSVDADPDLTNCQYANGVIDFKLTTTEGSGRRANTETRTFSFKPRSEIVTLEDGEDGG